MKVVEPSFSYSADFGPATAFASTPMLNRLAKSRRGGAASAVMNNASTDFAPGLQAQARLARVDQDRDAPAPVRPLHHQYAVAVLDAEDEPGLELAQDHDASRLPPHGRGDRGFGGRHELPKDGLARLDADDQVGPRRMGITGARLG